jgi:hypothetical protein
MGVAVVALTEAAMWVALVGLIFLACADYPETAFACAWVCKKEAVDG